MDWTEACRILGVPESATEAEIKEQYLYKAQLLHPDKNQDKPENIRKRAETELVSVNEAYRFLSNPNNNPYKIPPKLAVEPMGIRFKEVNIGERKSTTLTIRNVGGPYTSIWIDNNPAPWLIVTGLKSIGSERLPMEVILEGVGTGEQGKEYTCDLVIKLENENTHVIDQAIVKIELYTKVVSPAAGVKKESTISTETVSQLMPQNRPGFSVGAFVVNFLGFTALGIALAYVIRNLLTISDTVFIIGLILYVLIAFGFSFNHAISMGSKNNNRKTKTLKH
jgi:hypothetical protein